MSRHRVTYNVQLSGEFSLEAADRETALAAIRDMAEAVVLIPIFTGLKFEHATRQEVKITDEFVDSFHNCYASLKTGDDEIEVEGK